MFTSLRERISSKTATALINQRQQVCGSAFYLSLKAHASERIIGQQLKKSGTVTSERTRIALYTAQLCSTSDRQQGHQRTK